MAKDWKGLRVTIKLTVQNRQAKVTVVPSVAALIIKEPERDRKKIKNIKHNGNISLGDVIEITRVMRPKSMAKDLSGTVKEILGTCVSIGCTVDGKDPKNLQQEIFDGEVETEADILRLAAGVESNTNHPIGKAIVEAAHSIGCENVKAKDGAFTKEPGSGVVAIIEKMKVSVGTLSWVRRCMMLYEVKPEVKKRFISELQKEKQIIAMVGDGINDVAALASADVDIAMSEGVGAASDVSSVVVFGNKLSQVCNSRAIHEDWDFLCKE
ncbi:hypothetical protein ZIOFF_006418 [Zingiber officinale]|uniref:Large ribosomal subunit protein uL11 C-terminal domain-containing protein n=1 Tax=Zingiber officinale TaxID=94328 RepID=A0A8J5HY52_ZINOF|nr:hypothetical protein ZIOFF_006418 [Zingiber officinale]